MKQATNSSCIFTTIPALTIVSLFVSRCLQDIFSIHFGMTDLHVHLLETLVVSSYQNNLLMEVICYLVKRKQMVRLHTSLDLKWIKNFYGLGSSFQDIPLSKLHLSCTCNTQVIPPSKFSEIIIIIIYSLLKN